MVTFIKPLSDTMALSAEAAVVPGRFAKPKSFREVFTVPLVEKPTPAAFVE